MGEMEKMDEQEMQWEDPVLCISGNMGSDYEYCIVRSMAPEVLTEKVHEYVRLEEIGEIQPEEQPMEEYLEAQGATVIPIYASNGLGEEKPVLFFDVEYDVDTGIRLFSDLNIHEKIEMLMEKMEYIGAELNEEEKKWIKDYAIKTGNVTSTKSLIEKILMKDSTVNIHDRVLAMEESYALSGQEAYYAIFQINEDTKGKAYRFMGMDYAVSHGMRIDASDYNFVYSGQMTDDDTLDRLYERFNIEHPGDYTGHSLSVSDVIVLQEEQGMKAYYVDSFGYRELPDFLRRRQEMLNTDDLITNQTRGTAVEGHFGTWHTVEEKEIAGETFFRMEHDEYGDSVAGIIVNTDGKLVAEDLEHGFDAGAMEAITEYLYEKVPEPFIKQFYVVNDAYGVKAEREYQYFENLDEAIQAYHLLPNHLDKQLGMESRELVTSRMPLISCKNGIEEVEDIEKASLSWKWVNPEVTDAVNRAVYYLDNRDMEAAYSLTGLEQYFYIQTTDGGYDYTFYDAGYREIDGGIYENEDVSEQEAIEDILSGEAGGKTVTYKVMDMEAFLEQTERVQEAAMEQTEPTISFYAAECMEFPVMGEYHDNLTLAEAFKKYQAIPAERMNGIKGIGFRLEDGSMYDGDYELMRAGSISKDAIDLVPHYQESPLVQKAMADLEKMLAEEQQRKEPVQTEPAAEPGGQDRPGNMVQKPEASKPAGVRQSVLAALRERQAKQKAQEQQVQKEGEKTEKIAQGRRKGEPEL